MRVAIVHDNDSADSTGSCLVEALQRIFPLKTDRLEEAELVVSTSREAAQSVGHKADQLHLCYLTRCDETAATLQIAPASQRLGPGESAPLLVSQSPKFSPPFQQQVRDRHFAHRGITHFLAGSGRMAVQLKQEIGRPVKVIYPPVDTNGFRPDRRRRSDYYLTAARRGEETGLNLAVEAARIARRRLVVVVEEPATMSQQWRNSPHVQFVSAATAGEFRRYLCECRALLCCREVDFDADAVTAQACGTPVIVSSRSGISELVADAEGDGPGTGLYFDEPTAECLAATMQELERRPQKCSATLAWVRAKQFSVSRFERELTGFVDDLLAASANAVLENRPERPYLANDIDRPAA